MNNTTITNIKNKSALKLELGEWEKLNPPSKPFVSYGYNMIPINGTDKIFLFGGENEF